jgi:hypothetical protein
MLRERLLNIAGQLERADTYVHSADVAAAIRLALAGRDEALRLRTMDEAPSERRSNGPDYKSGL